MKFYENKKKFDSFSLTNSGLFALNWGAGNVYVAW
jgi:hypothetical protein